MDEGYIKFTADWQKSAPLPTALLQELNEYRQRVFDLGLIGAYDNGIGYGNISKRHPEYPDQFLISGSATGNFATLTEDHYALVTAVDIDANSLDCKGPIIASSESMSHAVIYQTLPDVQAIIHAHHLGMWQELMHKVPTTDASATYGSPEMAYSIIDLLKTTDLPHSKLFVMEGHEEGIFVFGRDLPQAYGVLFQAYDDGNS